MRCWIGILLLAALSGWFAPRWVYAETEFAIGGMGGGAALKKQMTRAELEALGVKTIGSAYFDKALGYKNSRLTVISFQSLLEAFKPDAEVDAVLLDCRDDYQGIIALADIRRYDLQLATRIGVDSAFKAPDWLKPLLIVVPDGMDAPHQERYVAANIREIRFVRLADYYAPLTALARGKPKLAAGLNTFLDNCLFCHSLRGLGGNKGIKLTEAYHFGSAAERERFNRDFFGFHNAQNPAQQNIAQFITPEKLRAIAGFLRLLSP